MLKGLIKGTVIFLAGVGVGYLVADTMKEEEYKQKAREEINEVKAIYKEKLAEAISKKCRRGYQFLRRDAEHRKAVQGLLYHARRPAEGRRGA